MINLDIAYRLVTLYIRFPSHLYNVETLLMSKDELQTLNVEALHQRLPCFSDIHPSAPIIFHYWLWIGKFSDLNL
jgi:hypothetical protein